MPPVDPRIIAGGIQAGADLIGGLFGMSAQDKANAANLQIAQEYNQMQRDIAAQNNQLQYQMFQESNYYNSPENQRKMLEEAGYNPYSLYSNPSGGVSYAQSLPSLQQPQMAMPQISPNFQFSNALQNAMGNAANVIKTLSEADKASSEKKLVDLNIQAFGDRLVNELKLSGEQGKALELQNQLFADTYDQKKYRATIDNLLADADLVSKNQSIQRAAFDYQLQVAFGFKLKQKELDKLGSEIFRNIEEGKTSADQRLTNEVNRWAIKKGVQQRDVELAINSIFAQAAKTQAGAAASQAGSAWFNAHTGRITAIHNAQYTDSLRYGQDLHNTVYATFGNAREAQGFLNDIAQGRMWKVATLYNFEKFKEQGIVNNFIEFNQYCDAIKNAIETGRMMIDPFDMQGKAKSFGNIIPKLGK